MRNSRKLLAIVLLVMLVMSLLTVTGLAVDVDDNGVSTVSGMAYTFWALVPPIVAIVLALITKEVFSSLFIGVLLGALFANNFAPVASLDTVLGEAIVPAITDLAGNFTLLQGIFPTQGLKLCLLQYRQFLYHLSHQTT